MPRQPRPAREQRPPEETVNDRPPAEEPELLPDTQRQLDGTEVEEPTDLEPLEPPPALTGIPTTPPQPPPARQAMQTGHAKLAAKQALSQRNRTVANAAVDQEKLLRAIAGAVVEVVNKQQEPAEVYTPLDENALYEAIKARMV